jgi:hypothetical protein
METLSRVPTFDGTKYEGMLNAAMQVSKGCGLDILWVGPIIASGVL